VECYEIVQNVYSIYLVVCLSLRCYCENDLRQSILMAVLIILIRHGKFICLPQMPFCINFVSFYKFIQKLYDSVLLSLINRTYHVHYMACDMSKLTEIRS